MPISFDVAIFGEKGTEHGLLGTTREFVPRGLVVRTDLPIDLPESEGRDPMLAGFVLDGYYILMSTARDVNAKRAGMARTVALFTPAENVAAMNDLRPVITELDRLQQADNEIVLFAVSNESASTASADADSSAIAVFEALAAKTGNQPIVWEGLGGARKMLVGLWEVLPGKVRTTFQFRTACRPGAGTSQGFDLVCSPAERISRWNGFQVVRHPFEPTSLPPEARPLLNQTTRGSIYKFANDLGLSLDALDKLPVVATCYSSFIDILDKSDLDVTTLFRRVARLSPHPTHGQDIKRKVCDTLVSRVKAGSIDTFKYLRNLSVSAYMNGASKISSACEIKFSDLLLEPNEELAQLVREAIAAPNIPWSQGVLHATKQAIADCKPAAAKILGALLGELQNEETANWVESVVLIAPSLEECIILHATEKVYEHASPQLLDLCRRQNWIRLHARVGSKLLSATELLHRQALLEGNLDVGAAELSSELGASQFAKEAVEMDVEAYWAQVAIDCQHDESLFSGFDFRFPCWRYVFCRFIEQSISVPENECMQNIEGSWRAIATGELTDLAYVHALSQSRFANVESIPERASIWSRLSGADRGFVLEATANAWFKATGDISARASTLDSPLRVEVLARRHRQKLLPADKQADLSPALSTFDVFSELNEKDFAEFRVRYLTKNQTLSAANSHRLGEYVQQRGWSRLAKALLDDYKKFDRKDLFPALQACRDQFNMLTRFVHGISEGRMPDEAWWNEAVDVLSEAYPSGLAHNSLWERAGGALWEIPLQGSGKDQWTRAIAVLRRGRVPKEMQIGNLLWRVLEDGPNDSDVNALIDHCPFSLDLTWHEPFVD